MRSRWINLISPLAVAAMPALLAAQAVPDASSVHGLLSFDAKATVGDFTGTTSTISGKLFGAPTLSGAHGWVEAPAKTLTTNNGHRDSDMATSLAIVEFPTIRFDLDSVAPGPPQGDSTAVTLMGRFTLHGQTRATSIPGWVWFSAAGVRFRGAVPVNVKEYGVGGLSHFLVLKMSEMITVRIDVTFEH